MKTLDLVNFKTQMEGNGIKIDKGMEHMEDNVQNIVKLLQNIEEKLPKGDDMGDGTHDDKK